MPTALLDGCFASILDLKFPAASQLVPLLYPAWSDIERDQDEATPKHQTDRPMANVIFKCPRTGMNVQHWLDEPAADDPHCSFETVICKACGGIHFLNRSSAKLLGEEES
jgi:hypothetical protein